MSAVGVSINSAGLWRRRSDGTIARGLASRPCTPCTPGTAPCKIDVSFTGWSPCTPCLPAGTFPWQLTDAGGVLRDADSFKWVSGSLDGTYGLLKADAYYDGGPGSECIWYASVPSPFVVDAYYASPTPCGGTPFRPQEPGRLNLAYVRATDGVHPLHQLITTFSYGVAADFDPQRVPLNQYFHCFRLPLAIAPSADCGSFTLVDPNLCAGVLAALGNASTAVGTGHL